MTSAANYSLRDEIKAYWSQRAATFDDSVGHEIFSDEEREAWRALFLRHLGPGDGRRALDLASGTGVISHLLYSLGFDVTGLDWAEPMLERARAKAESRNAAIRFVMGDAERTLEPEQSYDVIVTRHLVWTLVDPEAAFAEWFSLLRPGGRVLIVDGDFVSPTWVSRLLGLPAALAARLTGRTPAADPMRETHRSILAQVHFSGGARAGDVVGLLQAAGFRDIQIDHDLKAIHRAQAKHMSLFKSLERGAQHRYAISAVKR